jgi:glycosyltransferase involved in cell wall biosynthesis
MLFDRTGVAVFASGLLRSLAERGDLELAGYSLALRGRGRLADVLPAGVRACRIPMATRPLLELWQRFDGPLVEWWTGRTDVVHGTNFVVPPTRRAAEVVTVHDLTPVRFPALCEPATLRFPELIRRALRRGAMVHTHTAAVAAEVVDLLGAREDRVRVVPPGIDRFEPGPIEADGRPYILGLGTVEPRKDFPTLVRAFDAIAGDHADLELVVAGPPGWGDEAMTTAIEQVSHRDRVRRLGWVTPPQRAALLSNATVFAFPSLYEGFGLPPLEAMNLGVPVVATSAVHEVVGDAARVVPPHDTNALAAALTAVIDDSAERSRLIQAGRSRAAEFTWERCASGLRDLYVDALG